MADLTTAQPLPAPALCLLPISNLDALIVLDIRHCGQLKLGDPHNFWICFSL